MLADRLRKTIADSGTSVFYHGVSAVTDRQMLEKKR
jgi:hypothetical protein